MPALGVRARSVPGFTPRGSSPEVWARGLRPKSTGPPGESVPGPCLSAPRRFLVGYAHVRFYFSCSYLKYNVSVRVEAKRWCAIVRIRINLDTRRGTRWWASPRRTLLFLLNVRTFFTPKYSWPYPKYFWPHSKYSWHSSQIFLNFSFIF